MPSSFSYLLILHDGTKTTPATLYKLTKDLQSTGYSMKLTIVSDIPPILGLDSPACPSDELQRLIKSSALIREFYTGDHDEPFYPNAVSWKPSPSEPVSNEPMPNGPASNQPGSYKHIPDEHDNTFPNRAEDEEVTTVTTAFDGLAVSDSTKKQSSPLLRLPPEVRNTIYRLVLVEEGEITVPSNVDNNEMIKDENKRKLHPGLLDTCKVLHQEATSIFYQENKFKALIAKYDATTFLKWSEASDERRRADVRFELTDTLWTRRSEARQGWTALATWANEYFEHRTERWPNSAKDTFIDVDRHVEFFFVMVRALRDGMWSPKSTILIWTAQMRAREMMNLAARRAVESRG